MAGVNWLTNTRARIRLPRGIHKMPQVLSTNGRLLGDPSSQVTGDSGEARSETNVTLLQLSIRWL
jgi:hypothetical protein